MPQKPIRGKVSYSPIHLPAAKQQRSSTLRRANATRLASSRAIPFARPARNGPRAKQLWTSATSSHDGPIGRPALCDPARVLDGATPWQQPPPPAECVPARPSLSPPPRQLRPACWALDHAGAPWRPRTAGRETASRREQRLGRRPTPKRHPRPNVVTRAATSAKQPNPLRPTVRRGPQCGRSRISGARCPAARRSGWPFVYDQLRAPLASVS